jgi:hypothetical protein
MEGPTVPQFAGLGSGFYGSNAPTAHPRERYGIRR